jgi:hypothetical protein
MHSVELLVVVLLRGVVFPQDLSEKGCRLVSVAKLPRMLNKIELL